VLAATHARALTFTCEGDTLVGVLHEPIGEGSKPCGKVGVLLIVGGPQYRVGSHQQFVHLGRSLANSGYPVFRFDARGMGDSTGDLRNFENVQADIASALDAFLQAAQGVNRVVLWGLCDGASAALLYLDERRDPRVCGLCLLNPWVRSEGSLAATRVKHYYTQRLLQPAFWRKLVSGTVARGALTEFFNSVVRTVGARLTGARAFPTTQEALSYQARMARAWRDDRLPLLLILSRNDYTAKEFSQTIASDARWRGALTRPRLRAETLDADHTFSTPKAGRSVELLTAEWLRTCLDSPVKEH
jgi:exosortase A-associated hydrolase 1